MTRDGVMEGPNFELYKTVKEKFPQLHIAASGGVRGIDDFKALKEVGVQSAVFGRAFYEGMISVQDLEKFLAES